MMPAQVKPAISPELLNQIDIRVGTIEAVSDVANSTLRAGLRIVKVLAGAARGMG